MYNVLIVEDEKPILEIIKFNLKKEGYNVIEAYDGEVGLYKALNEDVDLILLDIMLPKINGFVVCKKIREKNPNVPIIMLTAREEEEDKVKGLELGADDYVTKPFGIRELMARVKANLRKIEISKVINGISEGDQDIRYFGNLTVNSLKYEVKRDDVKLDLTSREFELLQYLIENINQVVAREELLEEVWGYKYYGDLRTVDVTIRRLREKLEEDSSNPKYIMTKRGVGYYFEYEK